MYVAGWYPGIHYTNNFMSWWRHQMEHFPALPVTGEISSQKSSNADIDVSFDVGSYKLLNKRSNDPLLETTYRSCDVIVLYWSIYVSMRHG